MCSKISLMQQWHAKHILNWFTANVICDTLVRENNRIKIIPEPQQNYLKFDQ